MAKLADFGGSIFELDEDQMIVYGGTAIYNAPEQEGRGTLNRGKAFTYQELYQADVYSFGLTVWETLKNGHQYIEAGWLEPRESKLDALHRICALERDGILARARTFCEHVFERQEQLSVLSLAFLETFKLTLRDDAQERSSIGTVMEALAQGAHAQRPQPAFPSGRSHPTSSPEPLTRKQADGVPRAFTGYKLVVRAYDTMSIHHEEREDNGSDTFRAEEGVRSSQIVTVPAQPPHMGLSQFRPQKIDLFQLGSAPDTPWEVQHDVVDLLQQKARACLDTTQPHKAPILELGE
ncbi:MAG: hypothetical protein ALECFALPRED_003133 [Alectoria fallacina]|uniref:Protein kinase domain-containing protein n=1 Tax=Alectoria fallacina TaxID=1903189 RepID=A0A8H3FIU5_9LECA|nr:MAG: hypothetical protein ALECFALPRED_003133 [Alectoria fallacina]